MEAAKVRSRVREHRIREAMEHATSGMALTDVNGQFEETNVAYRQIVARSEEELISESILSLTHTDDREICRTHLQGLTLQQYPSFVLEKRYTRPDGEAIWVRNSFSLLRDPSGVPSHIVLICNDVTSRRRAERLLVESERLSTLGKLAASIAHEINNPMESVLNLLYLAGRAENPEEAGRLLIRAGAEVRNVIQIASHTLSFQRTQPRPVPEDLGQLMQSVLILFSASLAKQQIVVELQADRVPSVICFPGEIRQVFANLIRNAVEAMPDGGRLCVRMRRVSAAGEHGSRLRVTIADTGHGMSPEVRKHLFEAFFTTKGEQGNGLGLWITRQILAKHRATLQIRSSDKPSGNGSVFTMLLPEAGASGREPGVEAIAVV